MSAQKTVAALRNACCRAAANTDASFSFSVILRRIKHGTSLILSLIILISGICGTAEAIDDWPMFHHDSALGGYSISSAPDTNTVLWIYDTNTAGYGGMVSSPAIVNGILYIGAMDSNLYAVNVIDGSLIWVFHSDGVIHSSPAVSDDKVYFLSEAGSFYALDADTNDVIWQTQVGDGPWDWSSPAVHNGYVFIASSAGYVYRLDANTGEPNWSKFIGGSPDGPMAVANGKVYSGTHNFGNGEPTLAALDEITGQIIWTYDYYLYHNNVVGMVNNNGAAVADGDNDGNLEVYFGVYNWNGTDDQAVCLDEANGVEIWTTNIGGSSTSTPAVHNGKVFIGSDDGKLYVLNAVTGEVICDYQTGSAVWAAPAVADGKVFFGSLDHKFYAIDETTCELVWCYDTGASRLEGSPAVYQGSIYVGNENGKIYAFGPSSNLTIEKVDDVNGGDCRGPGDYINYTIFYGYPDESNEPNLPGISDVNIVDNLPAEVDFNSASAGGVYEPNSHTVIWNIGTLEPNDSGLVALTVKVKCAQPCGTIINECEIKSGDQTADTAYEYTSICCPTITKVDDANDCVLPDVNITYNIYYYANGYSDTNVAITDFLADEVNYVSSDPCGFYDPCSHTVIWDIGTLGPDDSNCFKLVVQVNTKAVPDSIIINRSRMTGSCIYGINVYESTFVCPCFIVPDAGSYADEIMADDPCLYLRFGDDPNNHKDSSGNNYWVEYGVATSIVERAGGIGKCIYMTGTGYSYAAAANRLTAPPCPYPSYCPADYNDQYAFVDGDITFEFWWKGSQVTDTDGIFFQQTGEFEDIAPGLGKQDANQFRILRNGGWDYPGMPVPLDGQWHHIVVAYDEQYNNDPNQMLVRMFLDSVLVRSIAYTGGPNGGKAGPEMDRIIIGAGYTLEGWYYYHNFMQGYYDEFAIYPGILDACRVAAHYAAWEPRNCQEYLNKWYAVTADLNQDCKVDFADFAEFALDWMLCNEPNTPGCTPNW